MNKFYILSPWVKINNFFCRKSLTEFQVRVWKQSTKFSGSYWTSNIPGQRFLIPMKA